jgi:hypothetical protein
MGMEEYISRCHYNAPIFLAIRNLFHHYSHYHFYCPYLCITIECIHHTHQMDEDCLSCPAIHSLNLFGFDYFPKTNDRCFIYRRGLCKKRRNYCIDFLGSYANSQNYT